MCKCVHSWSRMSTFHLKYVQIFYGSPMDPDKDPTWILCEDAAGRPWIPIRILHGSYVFTADPKLQYFIWNMCKSVRGSLEDQVDPYKDPIWILCGGAAGRPWIPIRILDWLNVFTADPKCKYFIGNMCKCVRRSLDQPRESSGGGSGGATGGQRGGSGGATAGTPVDISRGVLFTSTRTL